MLKIYPFSLVVVLFLVSALLCGCGPVIQRTASPLDNTKMLTMTRRYYSLENQHGYGFSGKYKLQIQWVRPKKKNVPVEAVFSLTERVTVLPDFQDTLFISTSHQLMKIPMTHYQSNVQTRRTEENTMDYRLHQGRVSLSPQQQEYIEKTQEMFFVLKRDVFSLNFKVRYTEINYLKKLLSDRELYLYN